MNLRQKCSINGKFWQSFYKPQNWKKKKREKKKHWEYLYLVLPGTNISLDQSSIYTGTKLQTLWVCL